MSGTDQGNSINTFLRRHRLLIIALCVLPAMVLAMLLVPGTLRSPAEYPRRGGGAGFSNESASEFYVSIGGMPRWPAFRNQAAYDGPHYY